jgi:hypothetical protein
VVFLKIIISERNKKWKMVNQFSWQSAYKLSVSQLMRRTLFFFYSLYFQITKNI